MKVQHRLSPAYAQHFQTVRDQILHEEEAAFALEGKARFRREQAHNMRKHLSQLIEIITQAEQLPASTAGYSLSEDGTVLIGDTEHGMAD
jgi:hypothetical protein